jgi:hypothetical protein
METFDVLDLDDEWVIDPAPALQPYGAITAVTLAWQPKGLLLRCMPVDCAGASPHVCFPCLHSISIPKLSMLGGFDGSTRHVCFIGEAMQHHAET